MRCPDCHGRAWPGHPRLLADADEEDVDGRATPGHDSGIDESLSTSVGISRTRPVRGTILCSGRLLAPSIPVSISTRPPSPPAAAVMAHPIEDGTDRQVA